MYRCPWRQVPVETISLIITGWKTVKAGLSDSSSKCSQSNPSEIARLSNSGSKGGHSSWVPRAVLLVSIPKTLKFKERTMPCSGQRMGGWQRVGTPRAPPSRLTRLPPKKPRLELMGFSCVVCLSQQGVLELHRGHVLLEIKERCNKIVSRSHYRTRLDPSIHWSWS